MSSSSLSELPSTQRTISIVLPVYNESGILELLVSRVSDVLDRLPYDYELILINDGSSDDSGRDIDALATHNHRVRAVHFSRNFGHQAALHAGLTTARGDAVIVMDSDLQDDPTAIADFVRQWEAGYEIVYAVRTDRKENLFKRTLFYLFYRVLRSVSDIDIPADAGNFGLIDRRVANHIVHLPEVSRFYPGLRSWVGFRQIGIEVERAARHDDTPRVTLWGLVRLARTALFSFSSAPLTLFYGVALISCLVCMGLTTFTIYHKIMGNASPGWASALITASFFGSLNALGIAILGEYVVRIFDQVRCRPQYVIDRTQNIYPAVEHQPSVNESEPAEKDSHAVTSPAAPR